VRQSPKSISRVSLFRWLTALAWLAVVLVVTIGSASDPLRAIPHSFSFCFSCADGWLADDIVNALLFLPLGLLVTSRRPVLVSLAVGAALSSLIEVRQLWLPGRFAGLSDICFNTLGAGFGALLAGMPREWLRRETSSSLRVLAALLPLLPVLGAAVLLRPAPSARPYFGQWTPEIDGLERYRGRVAQAMFNELVIPEAGPFPKDRGPEAALRAGEWSLDVQLVKGATLPGWAPLVRLNAGQEIVHLAADGEDLVIHEKTHAEMWRLRAPNMRFQGAMAPYAVGSTMALGARRSGLRRCLHVGKEERCELGVAPARTWTLLLGSPDASSRYLPLLDAAWLAGLFLPLGLLGGSGRSTWVFALASVLGMFAIANVTALVAPAISDLPGALLGVAMGCALRALLRRAPALGNAWSLAGTE
jgi:hypothetical protein